MRSEVESEVQLRCAGGGGVLSDEASKPARKKIVGEVQ